MGDFKMAVTLVGLAIIIVLVLLLVCRMMGVWTWTTAWLYSSTEEKVGLTRIGHYNANGYLVPSDSDLVLNTATGSFKRFDPIERDYRLISDNPHMEMVPIPHTGPIPVPPPVVPPIPPQPLRPVPAPPAPPPLQSQVSVESTDVERQSPLSELGSPELPPTLKRAISCDSVDSDTSVVLGEPEESAVSGQICVGLEYDSEAADLVVSVVEAKDIMGALDSAPVDTYARVYLLPDKTTNMHTRVCKKSNNPVYKEKFLFGLELHEFYKRSLVFYIYSSDKYSQMLIGEAELKMADVSVRDPITMWLPLRNTGQLTADIGEIMFSLSYLPTAERLTVVVVKAKNVKFAGNKEVGDPFVKVYLLQNGKKVHKKKTSNKKGEKNPIFNEAMIFSVPAHALQTIHLRVTVAERESDGEHSRSVGHVIVGPQASGKALSHWNQMLSSLRKPTAMWHALWK